MASTDRTEVRSIIKFCQELGHTPTQTYKMLGSTLHRPNVSRALVFKWHRRFRDGRESLHDDEGRGRKREMSTTLATSVSRALTEDRRLTVRALSERFGVSYGTIYTILTEELKMSKVCKHFK